MCLTMSVTQCLLWIRARMPWHDVSSKSYILISAYSLRGIVVHMTLEGTVSWTLFSTSLSGGMKSKSARHVPFAINCMLVTDERLTIV